MLNLLQMELMRLRKNRSTYWIAIVFLLIIVLSMVLNHFTLTAMESFYTPPTSEYNVPSFMLEDFQGEKMLVRIFSNKSFLLFLNIFAALFFTQPYRHGFIKNFLPYSNHRKKYALAQFLSALLYAVILGILGLAIQTLSYAFVYNGIFTLTNPSLLVVPLLLQILAHGSFLALLQVVATWTSSMAATLVFGLFYGQILGVLIYDFLTYLVSQFIDLHENFNFMQFTSLGAITNTTIGSTQDQLILAGIVATILLLIYLFISTLIMQKKDY